MSFNIFESAKSIFNNDLINHASSMLGEDQATTQKAVEGIVPTIMSGLINKASTASGAADLVNTIKTEDHGSLLSNLGSFFGGGDSSSLLSKGASLVSGLFGDKSSLISNAISSFSGIKSSSATSLMGMVAPALLGLIHKHADTQGGLSASTLSSTLDSQKSLISKFLPAGLSSLLGGAGLSSIISGFTHSASDATSSVKSTVTNAANTAYAAADDTVERAKGGMSWLLPLLLAALAIGALLYFWKGCKSGTTGTDHDSTTSAMSTDTMNRMGHDSTTITMPTAAAPAGKFDSVTHEFLYDAGKLVDVDLAGGSKLHVGENSTEAHLVKFLNDKSAMVDTSKGNWYEFTNVKFKTGSSEITDASMEQLKNMVAIAKAYPTASFKVGGYTDNVGKEDMNVALSQKRADAVLAKLESLGAAKASFTGAKGYGPAHPIGDNATDAGKALNRRVAVNVKAK